MFLTPAPTTGKLDKHHQNSAERSIQEQSSRTRLSEW